MCLKITQLVQIGLCTIIMSICAIYCQNTTFNGTTKPLEKEMLSVMNCRKGYSLSKSVCLPKGYLKGEVPAYNTTVFTYIEINNIRQVDDKEMRVTLDFYLDMTWKDNRIRVKFPPNGPDVSVLNNHLISNIWKPDLWIKNLYAFEIHEVLEPTGGLTIRETQCQSEDCSRKGPKRNSIIRYNLEALATIYCNFNFLKYPMDTQYCDFELDGAYPERGIVYFNLKGGQFGVNRGNRNTDKFEIDVSFQNQTEFRTGIKSTIKMKRCLLPFIIKYYLPCIAIIVVSLISFLISIDSLPARVALLVTQFLTLTNILIAQQVGILDNLIIRDELL